MANEKRLIDAKALIAEYDRQHEGEPGKARKLMEDAPTVDAVEVVHGRWEPHPRHPGFDRCSICHNCIVADDWADGVKWRFCPQCGANMDL